MPRLPKVTQKQEEGMYGVSINLLCTLGCNFKCDHCMQGSSPRMPSTYLSEKDLLDIRGFVEFVQAKGHDVAVNFVGGEPTLDVAAFDWIVRQVANWDVPMMCTTNGSWLRSAATTFPVLRALQPIFESDGHVRISDSPYHREYRTEVEKQILKAGLSALAGSPYDYWDDCRSEVLCDQCQAPISQPGECNACGSVNSEDVFYEAQYRAADAWPIHLLRNAVNGDSTLYIDRQGPDKLTPTGRAAVLGVYADRSGSCYPSSPTFTFKPGALCHDVCCSGGYVPMGHATKHNQLWNGRYAFTRAMEKKYPDVSSSCTGDKCRDCPSMREQFFRKYSLCGRTPQKVPQPQLQEA